MTAAPALVLAGLAIFGLGAGVALVAGVTRGAARPLPYLAGVMGSACLVAVGVLATLGQLGGRGPTVDLGGLLALGRTSLRLDPLAGLFLTITSGIGLAVSAVLAGWDRHRGRGLAAGYLLLLGSVAVIVVAGDAFTFLFGWESLTVAFYVLAGVGRTRAHPRAAWLTLGVGKVGGASLLLGFLLLAGRAGSLTLAAWAQVPPGALHAAAYALVVGGFAAKAGLVPFEVWLPVGYPAAPGPVRAAMAGLAVNVSFYGLWRVLGLLGAPPPWLAMVVLVLGGLTAVLGITFATVQSDLNRVIAYSSVENAGLILVGYGVALAGASAHRPAVVAVGLLAATLQVVAHALGKTGLFLASATMEADLGHTDLDRWSGLARSHPVASASFAAGALTLSGLPPTIGFVSEWFILEALMQQFRVPGLAMHLTMAGAGALVALTAGVAALCFVRVLGLAILGPGSRRRARDGVGAAGRAARGTGLVGVGVACFALAAAAPWLVRYLALGLAPDVPARVTDGALKSPWVLQPVVAHFSILSPSWAFVAMPVGLVVVALAALVASRGRVLAVRRVPAWRSASGGVAGPARYSAFGYANVARHVLGNVLGNRQEAQVVEDPGGDGREGTHVHVEYRAVVVEPVEAYLYRPARAGFLRASRWARRLQSGRLDAYVAYMLVALIALLIVVVALS